MLQIGLPGGVELLVILMITILIFGVPLVLAVAFGALWLRSDDEDYEERIADLEAEIARLQAEVGSDEGETTDDGASEESRPRADDRAE